MMPYHLSPSDTEFHRRCREFAVLMARVNLRLRCLEEIAPASSEQLNAVTQAMECLHRAYSALGIPSVDHPIDRSHDLGDNSLRF